MNDDKCTQVYKIRRVPHESISAPRHHPSTSSRCRERSRFIFDVDWQEATEEHKVVALVRYYQRRWRTRTSWSVPLFVGCRGGAHDRSMNGTGASVTTRRKASSFLRDARTRRRMSSQLSRATGYGISGFHHPRRNGAPRRFMRKVAVRRRCRLRVHCRQRSRRQSHLRRRIRRLGWMSV